jgi:hypothetical protein
MDLPLSHDHRATTTPSLAAAWQLKVDAGRFCCVRDQRTGIDFNRTI